MVPGRYFNEEMGFLMVLATLISIFHGGEGFLAPVGPQT
jgi:hypothetical protein